MPDGASNCGSPCEQACPAGTVVWLRGPIDSPDLFFSHWTGCDAVELVDAEPICGVILQTDRTIEADCQ